MIRKATMAVLVPAYLCTVGYFAFRPFKPILAWGYAPAELEWADGAVHLRRDASLEKRHEVQAMRSALVASGELSLEIVLRTDSLQQPGPGIIAAFTRDKLSRNFSLGQEGNGLDFRLRTDGVGHSVAQTVLLVPQVFNPGAVQHLVVSYDGKTTRLFVEGSLRAESAEAWGGFANWGRNHALVLGDQPNGGNPWTGRVWRFALYDRALGAREAARLHAGQSVAEPLFVHGFSGLPDGWAPLRYRNMFITSDPAAYALDDCLFNIAGFVPLGFLVYMLLPVRMERRKTVAVFAPMLAGLLASGTIEGLQRYVYMRVPCALDLVYNTTGSLLGGLLGWLVFSTFKKNNTKGKNA